MKPVHTTLGFHAILDLYGADSILLQNQDAIQSILLEAAHVAKATVLHSYFHHFGDNFGVTGILALAESHMSIHTWPENGYASIDIYMCGKSDIDAAIELIKAKFNAKINKITTIKRGEIN